MAQLHLLHHRQRPGELLRERPLRHASSIYAGTGGGLSIAQQSEPTPTNVPGPLPLFGAANAFGFSRKLRRRLRTAVTAAPSG